MCSSNAMAAGSASKAGAWFSYENATLAADTEKVLATNVTANIAGAEVSIASLAGVMHLNLWLAGGEFPVDVAYTDATEVLPVELFVRYRVTGGAWSYDGYVFPGLGTAFYRVPLPTSDEIEVVAYNPRATKTANVRAWGQVVPGSMPAEFVPHQVSSVIVPDGSAVASRAYGTFCFRRGPGVSQVRTYVVSTDSTAAEQTSTGFYRPSYSASGAYWGALTSSTATTGQRATITGDLVCTLGIFTGTFNNASTAGLRFTVAPGPYAP